MKIAIPLLAFVCVAQVSALYLPWQQRGHDRLARPARRRTMREGRAVPARRRNTRSLLFSLGDMHNDAKGRRETHGVRLPRSTDAGLDFTASPVLLTWDDTRVPQPCLEITSDGTDGQALHLHNLHDPDMDTSSVASQAI
ncbi:hypothetical protein BD626DRAFT_207599 [Schizophyllum amplum]|uniref:Uncharacterized protein n=1 Tax=Schizophyllum amplum TaxID=97359 RepID=A0A550BYI3_9AGAR|nr:hypothetical protein BD626DRAFT_207599 [Auriculariopsis ampla]